MLLDNDVVADGKAKAGAFSGRFGREERVEHLFFHVRRHTSAVVANPDFHAIAKVFCRGREGRLVIATISFCFALSRGIEAVCNQIQKSPRDVLREDVGFTGRRIKGPLSVISKPCFSARAPCQARLRLSSTMALISTSRCSPELSRECSNMFLTIASARFAVLDHFLEVAPQCIRQFVDLSARFVVERQALQGVLQFINEFGGETREIVDES